MDNRRLFLFAALIFVAFLIYQAWMHDYGPQIPSTAVQTSAATTAAATAATITPEIPNAPGAATAVAASTSKTATAIATPTKAPPAGQQIQIRTDLLDVVINTAGGDLQQVALLKYPEELKKPARVKVIDDNPANLLITQSGLQTHSGPSAPTHQALYTVAQTQYALASGEKTLKVTLTWSDTQGLKVLKTYTFTRGSYRIGLSYDIHNGSSQPWSGAEYIQFENHYNVQLPHGIAGMFSVHRYDYQRMAMYDSNGYQQHEFADLASQPLNITAAGGWTAVVTNYFLAAVIPENHNAAGKSGDNLYYTRALDNEHYVTGTISALQTVAPGASAVFADKFFLGPKLQTLLPEIAPGLQLTVDYGKFTIIAEPLFKLLNFLHRLVGNWGWAIILLTILVKLVFYPLNHIAFRSMAKMRAAQPRLKAVQERYKDDKQKLAQVQMEFYKKEKINPVGGCLPMIVQLPIFFALYYVLVYSVELRQSPWILWIKDLSAPDPYFILPILYGAVYFVQMHIQPQLTTDKTQRMIFKFMPLMMVVFYAVFPSGLVLYYLPNSVFTIVQQWFINRSFDENQLKHADKGGKRKK